ncbi:hypothetical protein HGP16_26005 [Rhizobium sp. P40RR-XXII]|uniref:hypothetical protein n=1 Tax=Rhizobium sp. P40RR-XXII TaxID=2726739 RepID=UPI0014564A02|nr:hypothetical protein [Rhizobium sp. P40RR-XXII]NLS19995.1 hypothetical protein [Rhizobium sp. P40RR-XXII]
MSRPTKSFIVEIKNSRRKKAGSADQPKSIWGTFAPDLKQSLDQEEPLPSPTPAPCPALPDLKPVADGDSDDATVVLPRSTFIEKWGSKKAEKTKAGQGDAVSTFLARIERQKALLAEFQADPTGFTKWRSAWFREVSGGFGVSVTYDSVDAGGGLRYIVVETAREIVEFLDDLAQHAQIDVNFQRALKENRLRRVSQRVGEVE